MSTGQIEQTYLPSEDDGAARLFDFLTAHEAQRGTSPAPTYYLAGPEQGDRVEVPREVHRALLQVVEALQSGKAVTVAPLATRLTTQQAADLLMISRPTLVKLLDTGEIPHERISTRRSVLLSDVLAYQKRRREAQYAALEASVDLDDDADPAVVAAVLADARAAVAARRRAAT